MSSEELSAIRGGSLPLAELLRINEHVRECPECARHVATAGDGPKRIEGLRRVIEREDETTFHISSEELAAYAGGRAGAGRAEIVEEHLQFCTSCAEDLQDLRSLQNPPAKESTIRWRAWLAAAASIVIAATIVLVSRREQQSARTSPVPVVRRETPAPPPAVRSSTPPSYGRAEWDGAVAAARQRGTIALSDRVATLRSPRSRLRTTEPPARASHALTPGGELVETTRPTFRWQAPAGATSVVVVSTPTGQLLSSDRLSGTTWQPPRALRPDTTYSWQVEITDGDEVTLVPRPPEPPVLFRTLTREASEELAEAKRQFPDDHLLMAVLYAKHGVLSTARAELEAYIAAENPPNAASLRESLEPAEF